MYTIIFRGFLTDGEVTVMSKDSESLGGVHEHGSHGATGMVTVGKKHEHESMSGDKHSHHDHSHHAQEVHTLEGEHEANGKVDHSHHQTKGSHHHHHHGGHGGHGGHGNHEGMALSATLHCLTGCAIGEMLGMLIGIGMGLSPWTTVALSISLAFVFGYALSALPVVRAGFSLGKALKLVLVADTLSIASMEVAENLIMLVIPGAMDSGLGNPLFWVSMTIAFFVGFAVAYPVNRILLRKGKGHAITHEATGHHEMNNKPLVFGLTAFMLGGFIVAVFG